MKRKRGERVNWDNVGWSRRTASVRADLHFITRELYNGPQGQYLSEPQIQIRALELLDMAWRKHRV
jgi:hypothetical protein